MRIKNLAAAMIISVLAFSMIPPNYVMAGEAGSEGVEISGTSIGGETVDPDEPEIEAAATENEYLISESCVGMEGEGIEPYSIAASIAFKRTGVTIVKASVNVRGDADVKKISSKIYLLKYVNGTYKYVGKKSTSSKYSSYLSHSAVFAVEKSTKYKIKVIIEETNKQGKTITKPAIYSVIS